MAGTRSRHLRKLLVAAGTAAVLVGAVALSAARSDASTAPGRNATRAATGLRDVMLVGNSLAGTVSFLDGSTFANLGSLNVIPDLAERLAGMNPIERAGYELVKQQEGGDRFVDDLVTSPDGRTLYVSRGNLADVAAFDLVSHQMVWRFHVDGIHADHMAESPDGTRLVISATTAQKAQVLDTATGQLVTSFATGTYPHANDYSADGKYLYNASIGITAMPQALEFLKGSRQLTVVDAKTFRTVRTYQFDHGIRPAVFTPDGRTMYAQLSYLNGFVQYDLAAGRIVRTVTMPLSDAAAKLKPDDYPRNSAHHGMAMSGDGTKLCDVGTIDNYVAIVSVPALSTDKILNVGSLPYWAQTSRDGRYCLVSNSNDNTVSVIRYSDATEVSRVPVGGFPQRERTAAVLPAVIGGLSPAAG